MSNYFGVCHVHSNHSEDADLPIPELAKFFKAQNIHFVCLTDHNPKEDGSFLSEQEMSQIVEECAAVSDRSFVMVPGVECETDDITHILGFGVTKPIRSKNWKKIVERIHEQGGLAVIAHPLFFEKSYDIELLELLDGIEVWNSLSSPGIPDIRAVNMLSRMRKLKHRHFGTFGIDFHQQDNLKPLRIIFSDDNLTVDNVLKALKTDGYLLQSPQFELGPMAEFPFVDRLKWYIQGLFFYKGRKAAKDLQNKLESNGIKIPEYLLKLPRKFFFH